MTTTTLSTWVSTYGVGRRHGSFSVRSSTPTTGSMSDRDAQGYWRVIRGGFIVERQHKVLDYQYLGLDADQLKACAVDSAGNAGAWETYTFSVTANEDADWVAYVDTSGDDSTGDGSLESPWATATKAVTEAQLALTSEQVGAIVLSDDQSWAHTGPLFVGSDSTDCVLRFVRRGNGTARPQLTFSANVTAFTAGKKGAFQIDGVDIPGSPSTSGYAFNLVRTGGTAADRAAWNVMVVDCEVSGFNYQTIVNNGLTAADRDDACYQFIAFQNVRFSASRSYYIYGLFFCNDVLWRDCEFVVATGAAPNEFTRTWALGRTFIKGCHFDISGGSSTRFWVGGATGGDDIYSMRFVTFAECTWYADLFSEICNFGIDTLQSADGIIRDLRLVDCEMIQGTWSITASDGWGVNTARIDFLECVCVRNVPFPVSVSATSVHSSLRYRNCGASMPQYAGGSFLTLNGSAANYAAASGTTGLQIDGCFQWMGAGNNDLRLFVNAQGISRADLVARIASMDYNHVGKADANSMNWVRTSSEGNQTLATWQGATAFDDHSSVTLNTTFNFINNGSDALGVNHDLRLASDSGPLAGTGYPLPLGVSIDADGFLRSPTAPTAGPYEFGATDTPDDPDLPAPSSPNTMRRHGLVLGLRLRP